MKIKQYSYPKGIKLPNYNHYKENAEILIMPEPKTVFVSTKQAKGRLPVPIVAVGDCVKRGSVLAKSNQTFVFSPISGTVKSITKRPSIYGGIVDHIEISNDNKNEVENLPRLSKEQRTAPAILRRIFQAGLVDMDGYPLFLKFLLEPNEKIDTLIINACTDEPYLFNNIAILNNQIDKVLRGINYVASIFKLRRVQFVVTKETYKQISTFVAKVKAINPERDTKKNKGILMYDIIKLPDKYPIGDEKELIYALTLKEMGKNEKPKDRGITIIDVYSLTSITDAVEEGICNYKKLVSVVSPQTKQFFSTEVYVGTTFEDIKKAVITDENFRIEKVIAGGPMRGIAVGDLSVVVTTTLKGIVFMSAEDTDTKNEKACINCGKCTVVCPRNLLPSEIERRIVVGDYIGAKNLGLDYCIKCGCCAFVCPSKRYMVQRFNHAKKLLNNKGV